MKKNLKVMCLFILISICAYSNTVVKYWDYWDTDAEASSRNAYYVDVLKLALDKSVEVYGDYEMIRFGENAVQSRIIHEIKNGEKVNIFWTMTSEEREEELQPIRVPVLKGLLGYRIFIIRKGEESKFNSVNTFEELKKMKAGQGRDWPDTKILKSGGINVVTTPKFTNLFSMLLGKRFDYFPRGINEPWNEVRSYGNGKLAVEKNLLIQYPAPMFFFVNKENKELAERIETGLKIALEDGSFDKLFYSHKNNREIFELGDIANRKIFKIDNPLLTDETRKVLDVEEYWYKLGEEDKYK